MIVNWTIEDWGSGEKPRCKPAGLHTACRHTWTTCWSCMETLSELWGAASFEISAARELGRAADGRLGPLPMRAASRSATSIMWAASLGLPSSAWSSDLRPHVARFVSSTMASSAPCASGASSSTCSTSPCRAFLLHVISSKGSAASCSGKTCSSRP